mmetsp:Transcript_11202/g.17323  ORF Transcript_11202/g.17323 Transcript_11202/m.17323 type:complete len:472 (+) Transcript_11202:218-1633(+)
MMRRSNAKKDDLPTNTGGYYGGQGYGGGYANNGYGSSSSGGGFGVGSGAASYNDSSPYNSSSNRMSLSGGGGSKKKYSKGGGGMPFSFDKFVVACIIAGLFLVLTVYYRSSYNSVLSKFHTQSVMDAVKNYEKMESEKKRYEYEARANREKQDSLRTTIREMEKSSRDMTKKYRDLETQLQRERDHRGNQVELSEEHREAYLEVEGERNYLSKREKAWMDQVYVLQNATQRESTRAVMERFGPGPHHVLFTVQLNTEERGTFTVELAPLSMLPHANHLFLEQVYHELWDNTWFYLNGPHVLQAGPQDWEDEESGQSMSRFTETRLEKLSFPEYHEEFPHEPWTLGFTGRPGGPDWYINKADNTKPHGPGGQYQHDLEEQADSCFAKIVDGKDTLQRIFRAETYPRDSEYAFFLTEPVEIVTARIQEKVEDKIQKPKIIKNKDKPKRKKKPQRVKQNQEIRDEARAAKSVDP